MKLLVSQGPHLSAKETTASIMQKVIIALVPALIASTLVFGINALLLVATTVISCVGFEYLYQKTLKLPITIGDYSAVVTGILLAFNYPPTLPLWMAVIGAFVAIVVVKQLFGGIGFNFANPAIAARIVMGLSFASYMNTWAFPASFTGSDVLASATPLAAYRAGAQVPLMDMLMGTTGGVIGETSAIALIIGFVYLVATKVISPIVPVTYVGAVAIFAAALGQDPLVHILGGGLLLGAIFMATDYTTSPYTTKGKIVFALGLAFITVMIRCFGSMTEGVSYAILLMNILVPYINRATRQKVLDGTADKKTTQFVAGVVVVIGVPLVFAVMNIIASMGVTTVYATGYQSDIAAMITFDANGAIATIEFDTSKETEGFGTKVGADPAFAEQFVGISSASEISADIIAGATVTSDAAIEAVATALGGSVADIPAQEEVTTEEVTYEGTPFTAQGYESEVTAYVVFDSEGAIKSVQFDTSNETPGFGTKVGEALAFPLQFAGLKAGDTVEADVVAGATVTSNAVIEAVKAALESPEALGIDIVTTKAEGYMGADITANVVFDENGAISSVEIDTSTQTMGYGSKISEESFVSQFVGITSADEVSVDIVSGATITSEAAIQAVKAAFASSSENIVTTTAQGWDGAEITANITFDANGAIASVEIDTSTQTEGIGSKISEEDFVSQFIGITSADEVTVDVIAGSTVTSEAAIEAVKAAFTDSSSETTDASVVTTTAQGWEGAEITANITFDANGAIASIEIDTSTQTDGIGSKISEEDFVSQFIGFTSADEVEVDVVAGATVTSEAAIEAVKAAFN